MVCQTWRRAGPEHVVSPDSKPLIPPRDPLALTGAGGGVGYPWQSPSSDLVCAWGAAWRFLVRFVRSRSRVWLYPLVQTKLIRMEVVPVCPLYISAVIAVNRANEGTWGASGACAVRTEAVRSCAVGGNLSQEEDHIKDWFQCSHGERRSRTGPQL